MRSVTLSAGIQRILPAILCFAFWSTGCAGEGCNSGCDGADPPAPVADAPLILSWSGPSTLARTDTASLTLVYEDGDADIDEVRLTTSNSQGSRTTSIDAPQFEIDGSEGTADLPLSGAPFAFGPLTVEIVLVDASGLSSDPAALSINIVGSGAGGSPPSINLITAPSSAVTRVVGEFDRVVERATVEYADADADIGWLQIEQTVGAAATSNMQLVAQTIGIEGVDGELDLQIMEINAETELGDYRYDVTLFDAAGNGSEAISFTISVVASGGRVPLSVTSFSPTTGPAGTEVTINGTSFAATLEDAEQEMALSFGGQWLPVISCSADEMVVVIPEAAGSSAFFVRRGDDMALSADTFTVPATIALVVEDPEVTLSGSLLIDTQVISAAAGGVSYSVEGILWGDSTVGTIDEDGVYTGPEAMPASNVVTITAVLDGDPSVTGSVEVTLLSVSVPGEVLVSEAFGGSVLAADGRSSVTVPANAVSSNTLVSVETLHGADLPTAAAGQQVLGGAEFSPDGLVFAEPVTVGVPLAREHPPGTQLSLQIYEPSTGTFSDEGLLAAVGENGDMAYAEVSHFTVYLIVVLAPDLSLTDPVTISSLTTPTTLYEGMSLPVHLSGADFTADLTARVADSNGDASADVTAGTLFVRGNEAGVNLSVDVVSDLADGQTRAYRLQLWRGELLAGSIDFDVAGLDELTVPAGSTVQMSGEHTYSSVLIDGIVSVPTSEERLELYASGPITINGTINAVGNSGNPGQGRMGGAAGDEGAAGGRGRILESDDSLWACIESGIDWDTCWDGAPAPLYLNYGQNAEECFGHPHPDQHPECATLYGGFGWRPIGVGGPPGEQAELVEDTVEAIKDGIGCVQGSYPDCVSMVRNINQAIDEFTVAAEGNWMGGGGFPGTSCRAGLCFRAAGGGGGGGGGQITFTIFGAGMKLRGAGGGAGGDRGRHFLAVAGGGLHLGTDAQVLTHGGDGGDGSATTTLAITDGFGEVSIELDNIPSLNFAGGWFDGSGGGGGGGPGGRLDLRSPAGVSTEPGAKMSRCPGFSGRGGQMVATPENSNLNTVSRYNARVRCREGESPSQDRCSLGCAYRRPTAPTIHPDGLPQGITGRALLSVGHRPPASLFGPGSSISVDDPGTGDNRVDFDMSDGSTSTEIQLMDGFNRVYTSVRHPFEFRYLLSLGGDADADGLTDEDEIAYGTDPNDPDTDDDGLSDGDELLNYGTNPLQADSDNDQLSDGAEIAGGTNPLLADTDNDGLGDGVELLLGSNPNDNADTASRLAQGTLLAQSLARLLVVDPSSGAWAELANLGSPGFSLAYDQLGTLYAIRSGELVILEAFTGTVLQTLGVVETAASDPVTIGQLSYSSTDSLLYGVEYAAGLPTGQLVSIDPSSAEATRLGGGHSDPIGAVIVDDSGTLLAVMRGSGSDELVELSTADGSVAATRGGLGVADVWGLAFASDGTLLAMAPQLTGESHLLSIDITTGVASPAATLSNINAFDITVRTLAPITLVVRRAGSISNVSATFSCTNSSWEWDPPLICNVSANPGPITIGATPNQSFGFTSTYWQGCSSSAGNSCDLSLSGSGATIYACFNDGSSSAQGTCAGYWP